MSKHTTFRLDGDGLRGVAWSFGPREAAEREIRHYAVVYSQDGPVRVWEGRKRRRDLEPTPPPLARDSGSGGEG